MIVSEEVIRKQEAIHKQGAFVGDLARRLDDDVARFECNKCYNKHCRIQDDIKRLRRELFDLCMILDYYFRNISQKE